MDINILFSLEEINSVAQQLLETSSPQKCFAIYAEMGSGKTTLINALCKQLGVEDATSSPTFSIINEYKTVKGESIFHMDWYRLKGIEDAINTGIEDILHKKNNYIFIEWPEIAEELLPKNCVKLKIEFVNETSRKITTF